MAQSLSFGLIICTNPSTDPMSYLALDFAKSVVAQGYTVARVFFYEDGVFHANAYLSPASDEVNLNQAWIEFAQQQQLTLEICSGACLRRGLLDVEAAKQKQVTANVSPVFRVSGAGQIADISLTCDRVVQFN